MEWCSGCLLQQFREVSLRLRHKGFGQSIKYGKDDRDSGVQEWECLGGLPCWTLGGKCAMKVKRSYLLN